MPSNDEDPREAPSSSLGDPKEAMTAVLASHGSRYLTAVRRLVADEDEARDAFQEGMLAAWKSLPAFEGHSKLSTWVHRIVVNHAIESLRRKRRLDEQPFDDLMPTYTDYGHRTSTQRQWPEEPSAILARAETCDLVTSGIARLPETLRVPLVLFEIENVEISEIATMLQTTDNAVRIRVHRARQALKGLLDPHFTESGK